MISARICTGFIFVCVMLGLGLGIRISSLVPDHQRPTEIEWLTTPRPVALLPGMMDNHNWKLIALGYSRCPDVCPTTLGAMASLKRISDSPVDYFFLSLDAVSESSVVHYAAAFDPRIRGVTATSKQVRHFVDSAGAQYELSEVINGPVAHSTFLILVDPTGLMRGRVRQGFQVNELSREFAKLAF